jgi:ATP-dependent RNA helicase HelY
VMTTEVLRNMLYAKSSTLHALSYVVMDEVHYLADRSRGGVWEEVIIHLPESVTVVALSATVSNAEEFGEWLATVRGRTDIVVDEHRPVPLWQHVMIGHQLLDLFADGDRNDVNPELVRIAREEARRDQSYPPHRGRGGRGRRGGRSLATPRRSAVIERLERDHLLPAIIFVFSRAGCDDAVQQCRDSGLRLTTAEERAAIRATALAATRTISAEDLHALGFEDWLDAWERGLASHHAGLLPVFKEIVEQCFQQGWLKVVFATETLALGINMPARSVVLERLVKWNGETHVELTPGEYTQLTGRAGRRGIDVEGHGIVVWHTDLDPRVLAGLASTRTYPLRSSFQPSYNMAVNLVQNLGAHQAREVLETSFAQFQADRSVVGLATQIRRLEEAADGYREAMTCHLGDFAEYAALRQGLSVRERGTAREANTRRRLAIIASLQDLHPGDVIWPHAGRRSGPMVVVQVPRTAPDEDPRPSVLSLERQIRRLSAPDLTAPVQPLARLRVPPGFNPRNPAHRRDLANTLRLRSADLQAPARHRQSRGDDEEITSLRAALRQHPCHGCSDREQHARWAERWRRVNQELTDLQERIAGRTSSIARRFDRICDVLVELGYLKQTQNHLTVTAHGRTLQRLYSEADLLIAQCLREGVWRDLTPADLAAVCSTMVYEGRGVQGEEAPRIPSLAVETTLREMVAIQGMLRDAEARQGLTITPDLDAGFAWVAHRWAGGLALGKVLAATDMSAGDFVRVTRQLIDLLGQIEAAVVQAAAGEADPLAETVATAKAALARGVVY